ncbi:hypothetical protein H4R18_003611 [Coemansia javaensis]|uniref:Uncharacterized protein n=1 Tax=Coemansia javaensis TaxID=2761396 RepID=A0A9W8HBI5_9FUNG|nr:hypothetical protein H4R18_003611 [Coemansia javaensis]
MDPKTQARPGPRRPAATAAGALALVVGVAVLLLLPLLLLQARVPGWQAWWWLPRGPETKAAAGDRVLVELFVMSRCPDAVKVEAVFADVVPAVHAIMDVELKFIGAPDPNATTGVRCKHGDAECQGNIDELCALAHSRGDLPGFWRFLGCLNGRAADIGRDSGLALQCASAAGLDTAAFVACTTSKEGRARLLQSAVDSQRAGIATSATVRIDGHTRCVEDGGWRDCPGGHGASDFIRDICAAYRGARPRPSVCAQYPR